MPEPVDVQIATEATPALVAAINRLVPQLSKSAAPMTIEEVSDIIDSSATDLLVASDGDDILGLLTLVVFRIPTGVRGWIEDVVVDSDARGRGVGAALNEFAVELARKKGARTVDLTSRPSRDAANRLYHRLGFKARDTNVYRFDL